MGERYQKWVDWNKEQKNPLPPMTGNQAEFAEWLFEHAEDELSKIGNLQSVFESVRRFIKEDNKK